MVPESDADEGTTSKDGEEEGEGDAEGEDDSDSGEDEEGRQGGTPGEGRQVRTTKRRQRCRQGCGSLLTSGKRYRESCCHGSHAPLYHTQC